MVVQVILSQVGENPDIKGNSSHPILVQPMGRNLHDRCATTILPHFIEQAQLFAHVIIKQALRAAVRRAELAVCLNEVLLRHEEIWAVDFGEVVALPHTGAGEIDEHAI